LGGYFFTFVKIVTSSKFNTFGGFLAFEQLEINCTRASLPTRMEVVDVENLIMRPYCGAKNLKPSSTYTPFKDLNNGDFVLVRPHDPFFIPMWMGRTQCDVMKNEQNENFKMVRVQW
jgi:hypothetical protein